MMKKGATKETTMASLDGFYSSKAWIKCRNYVISCALERDGALYCSTCGREILGAGEAILHHIKPLDDSTVNDPDIALNPENLTIVCRDCHNAEHEKGAAISREKRVYIVYGGTNSQREHHIYKHATDGAIVLSVPRLQKALSPRQPRGRVFSVVWQARDLVLNAIEKRYGTWTEAWVSGEFVNEGEREALARRLGADCVNVCVDVSEAETTKGE